MSAWSYHFVYTAWSRLQRGSSGFKKADHIVCRELAKSGLRKPIQIIIIPSKRLREWIFGQSKCVPEFLEISADIRKIAHVRSSKEHNADSALFDFPKS